MVVRILKEKQTFVSVVILGGGGGALPDMANRGMCGPKSYGFSSILVINRISTLVIDRI